MYTTVVTLADTPKGGRVYLQGKWLLKAGFEPSAAFEVEFGKDQITLRTSETGSRRVSAKQNQTIPVIDIQNSALLEAFAKITKLQVRAGDHTITITPAHTARMVAQREQNFTEGSLFSGGGLMTEAAAGLGFTPRFAVELEPKYAEIYAENHPTADVYASSVEEVPWETLRSYAPLHLLSCGIPCEGFSSARSVDRGTSAKRDKSLPFEAHESGDMTFFALRAVEATNASVVVIENSPNYLNSGAGFILQHALRRMGYHVDARVISPIEYGELQNRKRAIIVARTDAPVQWPIPVPTGTRTLREILDSPEEVEGEWFTRATKGWLYDHWERQTEKGNGFASQIVNADSTSVGTIKKRYMAGQGDNPVLAHPTEDGKHRMFTLNEVKRLFGVRANYHVGSTKTTAGEILGQGVIVTLLREIMSVNCGLSQGETVQSVVPAEAVTIEHPGQLGFAFAA